MKCCILIMSMMKEPATRNLRAMRDTFIKDAYELQEKGEFVHTYDFIEYYYDETLPEGSVFSQPFAELPNYRVLSIAGKESVYNTYEKTYEAFKSIDGKYEWVVRINISQYLNMRLLDSVLNTMNKDCIYCNAVNAFLDLESPYCNKIYARGDMIIFSGKTLADILEYGKKYLRHDIADKNRFNISHVDDTMIGMAFIDSRGDSYVNSLNQLMYNFIPDAAESVNESNVSAFCIGSRIKTTPPNTYSGYSWGDNEFRKMDVDKFYKLHKIISGIKIGTKYKDLRLTIDSLLNEGHNSRSIPFVAINYTCLGDYKANVNNSLRK